MEKKMEKSESENDSDCYESAEEELEKNEVFNQNSTLKNIKAESESDIVNSVNSFEDDDNKVEDVPKREVWKDAVSYRKRPERVRRLDSITSSKKEPHKIEINDPDSLLQEITVNLSKNLNKSLNTIQQTSFSVKDMIMNSFPSSNLSEGNAFTYDDYENTYTDVDTDRELGNSTHSKLISNEMSKDLAESKNNDKENNKKRLENEINNLTKNFESNAIVEEDNSERFIKNESIVLSGDKNLTDIASGAVNEKLLEEGINEKHESQSQRPLTESNLVSNELEFDILDKEIKDQNEGEELLKENSSKVIVTTKYKVIEDGICQVRIKPVQLTNGLKITSGEHDPSISEISSEEESKENNQGANISIKEHESDGWNDSVSNASTEVMDSCVKGDWDDFAQEPTEDKPKNVECDLEALKTSLEKIVLQNEGGNQNKTESSQNESGKPEETSNVENLETAQDGWDDFDFSDHELENVNPGVKESEEANLVVTTPLKEDKEPSKNVESESKKILKQVEEKPVKMNMEEDKRNEESEQNSQTKSKRNVLGANKLEVTTEIVSERGVEESKPIDSYNWEWDNWDDDASKNSEEKEFPRKEEMRNDNEINEFEEKWSGWDTFAQKQDERELNWNLGSWSVNMLINKASAVTQGLSTVLEAGLGAPDPETLARMEKEERLKRQQAGNWSREEEDASRKNSNDSLMFPVFELTNLVAGVTSKIVDPSKIQEIGSKVISGGLDTLESFGKKTMEVLQEGDPGLKKKRALLLGSNKPVLSQVLKEAKEKAEKEDRRMEEKELFRKCQFETLFDDYQGMIHLEALEMLSTQCELKLDQMKSSLNPAEQEEMDGILQEVEQLCCLEDFYLDWDNFSNVDFKVSIELAVESLEKEISLARILQIHGQVDEWLIDCLVNKPSGIVIHQKAVSTLAELTAATVHQFHKTGELLSVKECRKTVEEVDALLKMTNVLCAELERLCGRFVVLCETMPEKDSITAKIDIVLKNAVSYIKQAFHLLVPILQVGAAT